MSDMAAVGGAIVEVVSDARKIDEFVPLFKRPEMIDPPKDGGDSIKVRVEKLQATMVKFNIRKRPDENEVERRVPAHYVRGIEENLLSHQSSSRNLPDSDDEVVREFDKTIDLPSPAGSTPKDTFGTTHVGQHSEAVCAPAEAKSKGKVTKFAVGTTVKARFLGGREFRGQVVKVREADSPITYDIKYEAARDLSRTDDDKSFEVSGAWVPALRLIQNEISEIVREYKESEMPKLDSLKKIYHAAMKFSSSNYLKAFEDVRADGDGVNGIIKICKEINGQIKNKESNNLNSATTIAVMYEHALFVKAKYFDELVCACADAIDGAEPITCAVKKIFRVLEKMVLRKGQLQAAGIRDVVRGTIVCKDNNTMERVLTWLHACETITITNVKENYTECSKDGNTGAWVDVKIILMFDEDDAYSHKCEIQIVHEYMMNMRKTGGGHDAYSKNRSLGEVIGHMQEVEDGAGQIEELKEQVSVFLKAGRIDVVANLARFCTTGMLEKVEGDQYTTTQIDHLDAQLAELMKQRDFVRCVEIQQQINDLAKKLEATPLDENAFLGAPLKMASGESSLLVNYPSYPLRHYRDECVGNFWRINDKYPGLQCISKDPFIFLVPNLLTFDQCRKLVAKGANHYHGSTTLSKALPGVKRTSSDLRVPKKESPGIQGIFSELLNAPISQLETLKLIRYEDGQEFTPHHDAGSAGATSRRRVTLFAYLNTPDAGGETHFTRYGIKVKPHAGLGVIHFPSRLSTANELSLTYREGAKVAVAPRSVRRKRGAPKRQGAEQPKRHGTVTSVTELEDSRLSVVVELDYNGEHRPFEGTEAQLKKQIPLLSNTSGLRDERVMHAGLPAVGEKFLVTQWAYESSEDADRFSNEANIRVLGFADRRKKSLPKLDGQIL
jgi:prolyl 4-hydroxylase